MSISQKIVKCELCGELNSESDAEESVYGMICIACADEIADEDERNES